MTNNLYSHTLLFASTVLPSFYEGFIDIKKFDCGVFDESKYVNDPQADFIGRLRIEYITHNFHEFFCDDDVCKPEYIKHMKNKEDFCIENIGDNNAKQFFKWIHEEGMYIVIYHEECKAEAKVLLHDCTTYGDLKGSRVAWFGPAEFEAAETDDFVVFKKAKHIKLDILMEALYKDLNALPLHVLIALQA